MSPEQYADYMGTINIEDIRIVGFSAFIRRDELIDMEDPSMDVSDSYELYNDDEDTSRAVVDINFTIKSEKEKDPVLSIRATYELIITTEDDLPDEFWELFKSITLPSQVWPYFREFVQSTTNRMNIPAFTLPFQF